MLFSYISLLHTMKRKYLLKWKKKTMHHYVLKLWGKSPKQELDRPRTPLLRMTTVTPKSNTNMQITNDLRSIILLTSSVVTVSVVLSVNEH